jgi:hypothetical protein
MDADEFRRRLMDADEFRRRTPHLRWDVTPAEWAHEILHGSRPTEENQMPKLDDEWMERLGRTLTRCMEEYFGAPAPVEPPEDWERRRAAEVVDWASPEYSRRVLEQNRRLRDRYADLDRAHRKTKRAVAAQARVITKLTQRLAVSESASKPGPVPIRVSFHGVSKGSGEYVLLSQAVGQTGSRLVVEDGVLPWMENVRMVQVDA